MMIILPRVDLHVPDTCLVDVYLLNTKKMLIKNCITNEHQSVLLFHTADNTVDPTGLGNSMFSLGRAHNMQSTMIQMGMPRRNLALTQESMFLLGITSRHQVFNDANSDPIMFSIVIVIQ